MEIYLILFSTTLIGFSLIGATIAENIVAYLIAAEMFFLGISLKLLVFSVLYKSAFAQIVALSVLVVGGAETAILLAMLVIASKYTNLRNNEYNYLNY